MCSVCPVLLNRKTPDNTVDEHMKILGARGRIVRDANSEVCLGNRLARPGLITLRSTATTKNPLRRSPA